MRKRKTKLSGRRIEKTIYDNLKKLNKVWVFRYNENRRNSTPADIQFVTSRYNTIIEVKSGTELIYTHAIRPEQRRNLEAYTNMQKLNLGLLIFYFHNEQLYVLVHIKKLLQFRRSRIKPEDAKNMGIIIKDWTRFKKYITRISGR